MWMSFYIYIMFCPMMFISIFMNFLSTNWISMWMCMEISLISIIMIMMFNNLINSKLLMKYLMFQAFNSFLFLLGSMMLMYYNNMSMMLIMYTSIMMKLAIFPFHYWYIKIIENLNWILMFYFTVINKLIPLYIFSSMMNLNNKFTQNFFFLWVLLSSMIFSIFNCNMVYIKLILGYSSMIQLSWMIILMKFNETMWLTFYFIYFIIMLIIFFILYKLNMIFLLHFMKYNKYYYLCLMLSFMSLASIPPMFGFLMKWLSTMVMMNYNLNFYYIFILMMNSLISSFFYFRMMNLSIFMYNLSFTRSLISLNFKFNMMFIIYSFLMFMLIFFYELI